MPIEVRTNLAERLVAGPWSNVLALDVIAGMAVRIVMVDRFFNRVPRIGLHRTVNLYVKTVYAQREPKAVRKKTA